VVILPTSITNVVSVLGLAGAARPELAKYPYISTGDANYSPELTGLLSQQATWQMLKLQPQLQQLLQGTNATSGTTAK
jgi:hypothetical protein